MRFSSLVDRSSHGMTVEKGKDAMVGQAGSAACFVHLLLHLQNVKRCFFFYSAKGKGDVGSN